MSVALDSSAVMAFLHGEAGGDAVERVLPGAVVSAVNWSEVLQKTRQKGGDTSSLREWFSELGVRIVAFDADAAEAAALLWSQTSAAGLSLADRACLALAEASGVPAVTTDRAWARLNVGVEVTLLR